MNKLINYTIVSILSAITSVLPSVSGGTIFAAFNLTNKLTTDISYLISFITFKLDKNQRKKLSNHLYLPLYSGLITLIFSILFSNILIDYYNDFKSFFNYLFISIIIFSIPSLYKESIKFTKFDFKKLLLIIIGLFISIYFTLNFSDTSSNQVNQNISFLWLLNFYFAAFVSGSLTIIPGISGTNALLAFGVYNSYITFNANYIKYLPINLGYLFFLILGIIFSTFLMKFLFEKHYETFYSFIIGMTFSATFFFLSSPFLNIIQSTLGFSLGYVIIKYIANQKNSLQED